MPGAPSPPNEIRNKNELESFLEKFPNVRSLSALYLFTFIIENGKSLNIGFHISI